MRAEEIEALVDVDYSGLFWRQPQSQRSEYGCHLLTYRLGVTPLSAYHDHKIVGVTDKAPVTQAGFHAFGPLLVGAHLLLPLSDEMLVQHRQGDIRQQRR